MIRMIFQRRGDKNRCGPNNPDQLTNLLNKTIADLQPSIWLAKKMDLRDPKGGRCLLRLGFPAIYQRALISRTAQGPVSNKNHMGLEFLLTCQNQGSTKAKGFVVRVRGEYQPRPRRKLGSAVRDQLTFGKHVLVLLISDVFAEAPEH